MTRAMVFVFCHCHMPMVKAENNGNRTMMPIFVFGPPMPGLSNDRLRHLSHSTGWKVTFTTHLSSLSYGRRERYVWDKNIEIARNDGAS